MENAKGAKLLKITGILMIIFGAIAVVVDLIVVAGVSVLAASVAYLNIEFNMGLYVFSLILALAGAGIELVTGIIGVINANNVAKAKTCMIWGIVVAAITVVSNICVAIAYAQGFNVFSLFSGLVIPGLFIFGAYKNSQQG